MIETDVFWHIFVSAMIGAWLGTYFTLYQFYAISKKLANAAKTRSAMIKRIAITGPFTGYCVAMLIYWPGRYFLGIW